MQSSWSQTVQSCIHTFLPDQKAKNERGIIFLMNFKIYIFHCCCSIVTVCSFHLDWRHFLCVLPSAEAAAKQSIKMILSYILHWDSWPVTSKPSVLNAVKSMMSWWSESFLFADISQYLTLHKKKPNLVGPKITPYCHLLLIESSPPNRPHREPKMSSKGNL